MDLNKILKKPDYCADYLSGVNTFALIMAAILLNRGLTEDQATQIVNEGLDKVREFMSNEPQPPNL